jgi:O-antigen ligase
LKRGKTALKLAVRHASALRCAGIPGDGAVAAKPRTGFSLEVLSVMLLALAWTVPFLQPYHWYPIASFYAEWSAAALGLSACVCLVRHSVWQRLPLPVVALVPVALALLILAQGASGLVPYMGQALLGMMYLVWAALLIVLGAVLTQRLGMQRVAVALALALVVGGECNALAGVLQHYDIRTLLDPLIALAPNGRTFGNLSQTNHYATYEALALASVAYLFAAGRFRSVVAVAIIAVPLIFALALSASRSAWLYMAVLLMLALFVHRRDPCDETHRLCQAVIAMVIAFAITQWLPLGNGMNATERILNEPGVDLRMQQIRTAWWAFLQSPLWGIGWRNFAWYDYQYQALFGAKYFLGMTGHTHNIITNLLAETGLAGVLIVVGGAIAWCLKVLKRRLDTVHWWAVALLGILTVHSMLEYPLWYAYFLGIAALILGMVGEHRIWNWQKAAAISMMILMAGTVILGTLWSNYRSLERLASTESVRPDKQVIKNILIQSEVDPVLRPYAEFAAALGDPFSRESIDERLVLNTRVMHFAPMPAVLYREAVLLALSGKREAALRQLDDALRVYPGEIKSRVRELRHHLAEYPVELSPLLELATTKLR